MFSFALAPYYWWWLAILSPPYSMQHCINAQPNRLLRLAGAMVWFMVCRSFLALHVYPCIRRYQCLFKRMYDCCYGSCDGVFTAFQTWVYRRFFPETPLTFAPLWIIFEWAKTWVFTGFPWLFVVVTLLLNVYLMVMHRYLVFMQFLRGNCSSVCFSRSST